MSTTKNVSTKEKADKRFLGTDSVYAAIFRVGRRVPSERQRYTDAASTPLVLEVWPDTKTIDKKPQLKGSWFARFRNLAGIQTTKKVGAAARPGEADGIRFLDYAQALVKAKLLLQEAEKTEEQKADEKREKEYSTLRKVWPIFLNERRTRKKKPLALATKRDYEKSFRLSLESIADMELAKLSVAFWLEFLTNVQNKHGDSEVLQTMNVVSAVYSFLVGRDLLDVNPITKVRSQNLFQAPPAKKRHVEVLNLKSFYESIEVNVSRQDSRESLKILLFTGFRLLGALGMQWQFLHMEEGEGYYFVPPNTEGWKGFSGVVPLSDYVLDVLRQRRERRGGDSQYIFPKRAGTAWPPHQSKVSDALRAVCLKAGLPLVSAHDLRRTFSTVANIALEERVNAVGMLMTHNWAVNQAGIAITHENITNKYIIKYIPGMRARANRVAELMLELAAQRPMSIQNEALLREAGMTEKEIKLMRLPDDE